MSVLRGRLLLESRGEVGRWRWAVQREGEQTRVEEAEGERSSSEREWPRLRPQFPLLQQQGARHSFLEEGRKKEGGNRPDTV